MYKILFIFLLIVLQSCKMIEYNCPKNIAEDILNSNLASIDSVFEANRSSTSFYTRKVIKTKPSYYFKGCKDFFNKEYYNSLEGQTGAPLPEYVFHYRCSTDDKIMKFKFIKRNNRWILTEIMPFSHY